jgi:hypothetical protein
LICGILRKPEVSRTDSGDRAIIGVAASREEEVIVKQCPSALNPVAIFKNESNPAVQNLKC